MNEEPKSAGSKALFFWGGLGPFGDSPGPNPAFRVRLSHGSAPQGGRRGERGKADWRGKQEEPRQFESARAMLGAGASAKRQKRVRRAVRFARTEDKRKRRMLAD